MSETFLVDSREKTPFKLSGYSSRITRLKYGDYSVRGLKGRIEIERKSPIDLLNSLTTKWPGFVRKCIRWRRIKAPRIIVVEGNLSDIFNSIYFSERIRRIFFTHLSVLSIAGISIMFCDNRELAEKMIISILKIALRSNSSH